MTQRLLTLGCTAAVLGLSLSFLTLSGCGGGSDSRSGTETDVPAIIATPTPPSASPLRYIISEVARLPFSAEIVARNRNGFIAGNGGSAGSFVLSPDGNLQVISALADYPTMRISGLNNDGAVVGSCYRGNYDTPYVGFIYDPRTGKTAVLPAMNSPKHISDAGAVAGFDVHFDAPSGNNIRKGVVYDPVTGIRAELPDFGGESTFQTNGITSSAWVCGTISPSTRGNLALYNLNTKTLRTIPPSGIYNRTAGGFVSENGKVGGVDLQYEGDTASRVISRDVSVDNGFPRHTRAFIYDISSGLKRYLPDLTPPILTVTQVTSFYINGSNDATLQVGGPGVSWNTALVYRNGRLEDLSRTLNAEDQATWRIEYVVGIDESGAVYAVCAHKNRIDTVNTTFVLRFTPL